MTYKEDKRPRLIRPQTYSSYAELLDNKSYVGFKAVKENKKLDELIQEAFERGEVISVQMDETYGAFKDFYANPPKPERSERPAGNRNVNSRDDLNDPDIQIYLKNHPEDRKTVEKLFQGPPPHGYRRSLSFGLDKDEKITQISGWQYNSLSKDLPPFEDRLKENMKKKVPEGVSRVIGKVVDSQGLTKEVMDQYHKVLRAVDPTMGYELRQKLWNMKGPVEKIAKVGETAVFGADFVWGALLDTFADDVPWIKAAPTLKDSATMYIRTAGKIGEKYATSPKHAEKRIKRATKVAENVEKVMRVFFRKSMDQPAPERRSYRPPRDRLGDYAQNRSEDRVFVGSSNH